MNSSNKNKTQNSFHQDKNLSREEIAHYLSTNNKKEKNAIEQKSLESNFDSDALEGWSESGTSISELDSIDSKFALRKNFKISSIVAVSLITCAIVFAIILITNQKPEIDKNAPNSKNSKITLEKTDVVIPEKIASMVKLPSSKAIKPKMIQNTFETKVSTPENIQNTQNHNESNLQVSDLPLLKLETPKETVLKTSFSAKEIYLFELKLVDYRAYRSKPQIKSKAMDLDGTPASRENRNSANEEDLWRDVDVPYIEYLRKTQQIFSKENYKKALTRYLTILETYPDDVNALFYSALCYYNLQQYQSAIDQFHACLGSKYDNFNEESEWFLAKSYASAGEREKSKVIYQLIIEKNGFYASLAKNALFK